jgi:GTP-binding protein
MKHVVFKDRVKLFVRAGNGGNGCVSFRREKFIPKGGPDGGDGGHGGSVILRCDANEDSLLPLYYQPHQRAKNAQHGMGSNCHGRNSEDRIVKVPPGTVVSDAETGEALGELTTPGDELVVAKGGRGGIGNVHFKSSTNQTPRQFTEGKKGEEKVLWLELKLMADVGLVGYPNAGKSTLLSRLTHAHPKVAPYPFTTINPIIGTLEYPNFHRLKIADIPGLIDGAHAGVGLGHQFLRHIERSKFILFVIDMAGTDQRNPADDFLHLREELRLHREELAERPYLVLANKMDAPEAEEHLKEFRARTGENPIEISAKENTGLEPVREHLYRHFFGTDKDA